jgi:hypothetical protein
LPEYEVHEGIDSEPIPGPSQHYHNPNFINNLPTISFPRNSSSIQRKHLASHSESATPSVLNTFNDNSKRHVKNAGTQTEPQFQVECLERRISEIELIIASKPSFKKSLTKETQTDCA